MRSAWPRPASGCAAWQPRGRSRTWSCCGRARSISRWCRAASPTRCATPGLESLGAVFAEPVWAFLRADSGAARLADLRGRRVAIGPQGSGTRVLALAMLAANDIGPSDFEALPLTGTAAAEALAAGTADAAILVSARTTGAIAALLRAGPALRLVDYAERADAYVVHLPFLSAVRLPRGGLSIAADLPAQAYTLLAPVASVVAHADIHPQVVSLLVGIMQEVHRPRTLFAAEGAFPNALAQDLPMNADAERYYARGRTVLQQWLPFWVAVWVERLLFVLLPVLGIALPLIRFGPVLYAWQMETRVWRHYDTLRRIEAEADRTVEPAARAALRDRLEALEGRVRAAGAAGHLSAACLRAAPRHRLCARTARAGRAPRAGGAATEVEQA